MAAKHTPARRKPAARRRTTATATRRKHPARRVKIPRGGPLHARISTWLVLRVIVPAVADRRSVMQSRKDAAILRATHQGCPTCHGNGTVYTKNKKTGEWSGSKPCPAKPAKEKVSRWEINRAARMGGDKRSGLIGWTCPCGKKEKPRYRDAKTATAALRAHNTRIHGGASVGGTWYAQVPKSAAPSTGSVTVTAAGTP